MSLIKKHQHQKYGWAYQFHSCYASGQLALSPMQISTDSSVYATRYVKQKYC